jgi:tRNA (Thr-GGU) A37 N-methylase
MIEMEPAGCERGARGAVGRFRGGAAATIVLAEGYEADALSGIEEFSHAEIVYCFIASTRTRSCAAGAVPAGIRCGPKSDLAQRGKDRPNRIGTTIARLVRREGRTLAVAELDAIDGSPVLDIKPVMREFLPHEPVRQPPWATDLMRSYWSAPER